ncbi:MAG: rhodanese-like domain-containing protein [Ruminococcaceae bacterium]|nr:rhodanese-like domain-containing protein [Oscillospiraceae bacterium]
MDFKKIKGLIFLLILSLTLFGGCSVDGGDATTEPVTNNSPGYEQISGEEAKRLMDTEKDYVIIDARTEEEFKQGHIAGAILIPEYEIKERAEAELADKDQLILVYCRSGRRSKIASQALADLGYTNVKEFGGIIDWQYETVK